MDPNFELCRFLDLIFHNWTALQYFTTEEMTRELKELTIDFVSSEFEQHELAYNLEQFIDHYFNSAFEDGSCNQVARDIYEFVVELRNGNSLLPQYEQQFSKLPMRPQPDVRMESSDDDDDDGDSPNVQLEKSRREPIIDDDGFELVTRKR